MNKTGQFRFTPPTHTLLAFRQALEEYQAEGGLEGRMIRWACEGKGASVSILNLHSHSPFSTSILILHSQSQFSISILNLHYQPPFSISILNLHSQPPILEGTKQTGLC